MLQSRYLRSKVMLNLALSPKKKACAVMQPYLFPYIGYFQLIEKSSTFVYYDDVSYIKKGWINKNTLSNRGKKTRLTLPVNKSSQNNLICNIKCHVSHFWFSKLEKTLWHFYKDAPNYSKVSELTLTVFSSFLDREDSFIADISIASIKIVCEYIGLERKFLKSSELTVSDTKNKSDRLILICKKTRINKYINMIGGSVLYDKHYFKKSGIDLVFLKPQLNPYYQGDFDFVPSLSVIDSMMHLDREHIQHMVADGIIT